MRVIKWWAIITVAGLLMAFAIVKIEEYQEFGTLFPSDSALAASARARAAAAERARWVEDSTATALARQQALVSFQADSALPRMRLSQLLATWANNPIAAEAKFRNQTYRFSGYVGEIGTGPSGEVLVAISDGVGYQVQFTNRDDVVGFDRGSYVTVICRVAGNIEGYDGPEIRDCRLPAKRPD